MISPSPTQQPPAQPPEQKKPGSTTTRPRPGQSPGARRVKNFFRPILRMLYYIITWIRRHFILTLALLLLLGASSYATAYFATQGFDPLHDIAARDQASAVNIRAWLDALRAGNASRLSAIQGTMLQTNSQPDPQSLVSQYGEPQTGDTWVSVTVLGVHTADDTSLDSFVEIDLASPGQNTVSSILIVHFTTVPALQGRIFVIDVLNPRQFLR